MTYPPLAAFDGGYLYTIKFLIGSGSGLMWRENPSDPFVLRTDMLQLENTVYPGHFYFRSNGDVYFCMTPNLFPQDGFQESMLTDDRTTMLADLSPSFSGITNSPGSLLSGLFIKNGR
jgi:hypothetical protein